MTRRTLVQAREFAATFLDGMRRQDLAHLIRAGGGDDFPEVMAAIALLDEAAMRVQHQEEALRVYADAVFWEEELPGGTLASHDRGQMARNALAGLSPFHNCE